MSNQEHLIILSIPFVRINRVLLSPLIKKTLQNHANLLIVSPFSDDKIFQKEFESNQTDFFMMTHPERFSQPFHVLYSVSEILRIHGYWMRYRKNGMEHLAANRFISFGPNGKDIKFSIMKRLIYSFLGLIGIWRKSWRFIDSMIGPSIFENYGLTEITRSYNKVTLIQSASWGLQDRNLGWIARKYKWRKVLIPYTTDQLLTNGHLISDFDAVCVQGPCEYDFAMKYHNIPDCRIKKLGSLWARYIDELVQRVKNKEIAKKRKKIIGYAGVSSTYFPIESELLGLEILLEAINQGELENTELVYRPIAEPKEIRKEIESRFSDMSNLSIQSSQEACYGMDTYDFSNNFEDALEEFIQQISCYDLLVMANFTSLCIELAYIGVPTISYLFDPTGLLSKRKTEKILNKNGREQNFPEIPVVLEQNQLITEVKKLLNDSEKFRNQAEATANRWDYKKADFKRILEEAIDVQ